MEQIISPVDTALLLQELKPELFLCNTNKGGNQIYSFDGRLCPNLLREVGRIRELAFRSEGGGSGLSMDIDEFDTMEKPYRQLIIWDPDAKAIIGGYRYIFGTDVSFLDNGQPYLATSHMFRFSDVFIRDYLPHMMELGRSFVSPPYQSSKAGAKAIFALDNLWDGISCTIMQNESAFFFFGKMTMYPSYNKAGRDLVLSFLNKHFPDQDKLLEPIVPVIPESSPDLIGLILKDRDFKTDYRNLKSALRSLGTNIPPLINSYMQMSPTMRVFGTAVNEEFSKVEETAIMICFDEIYKDKLERHIKVFFKHLLPKRLSKSKAGSFHIGAISAWNARRKKRFYAFKRKTEKV